MFEEKLSKWFKFMESCPNFHVYPSPPMKEDYNLFQLGIDVEKPLAEVKILPEPPFIMDQKSTPECTAFAGVGIYNSHYNNNNKLPSGGFSPKFLYTMAKKYDGIPDKPGTYLRIILKIMKEFGICREVMCSHTNSTVLPEITEEMLNDAYKHRIKGYARCWNLEDIKRAAMEGKYILLGTLVTSVNWYKNVKDKGFLGLPEGSVLGAHATYGRGYDSTIIYRTFNGYTHNINSWGTKWGDKGKFQIPFDYYSHKTDLGIEPFMEAWAIEFDSDLPTPIVEKIKIEMWVGKNKAIVNKKEVQIDPINPNVCPDFNSKWCRTLVPLRFVGEALGAYVDWKDNEKKVIIKKNFNTIEMWQDKNIAKINGVDKIIDSLNHNVTPLFYSDWKRIMIPIRFVAEMFGATVTWIESEQKVIIESK